MAGLWVLARSTKAETALGLGPRQVKWSLKDTSYLVRYLGCYLGWYFLFVVVAWLGKRDPVPVEELGVVFWTFFDMVVISCEGRAYDVPPVG